MCDMADPWLNEFAAAPKAEESVDFQPYANFTAGCLWPLPELPSFPGEVDLYRSAMKASECLNVLLDAGARSAWICRAAALEGRADLLALAVGRGCFLDPVALFFAAREGHLAVLQEILSLDPDLRIMKQARRLFPRTKLWNADWRPEALLQRAGIEAAFMGHPACLEALLDTYPVLLHHCRKIGEAAVLAGHLDCLSVLQRWAGLCGFVTVSRSHARLTACG